MKLIDLIVPGTVEEMRAFLKRLEQRSVKDLSDSFVHYIEGADATVLVLIRRGERDVIVAPRGVLHCVLYGASGKLDVLGMGATEYWGLTHEGLVLGGCRDAPNSFVVKDEKSSLLAIERLLKFGYIEDEDWALVGRSLYVRNENHGEVRIIWDDVVTITAELFKVNNENTGWRSVSIPMGKEHL